MTIGFEADVWEKKKKREEQIGKYVIIHLPNGNTPAGMIKDIKGEKIILNPHQSGHYEEESFVPHMVYEDSPIDEFQILYMTPTTRDSLENSCKFQANQEKIQRGKSQKTK